MNKTINTSLTTLFLSCFAHNAMAAEEHNVYGLEVQYEHNDNVRRTMDEQDDQAVVFKPMMQLYAGKGVSQFSLDYQGTIRRYNELSSFDHEEHAAVATYKYDPTARFNGDLIVSYVQRQELPGDTNAPIQTNISEFNQETLTRAIARVAYGTRESKGQIEFEGRFQKSEFDTNEQSFRDNDSTRLLGRYYHRVAPKTRAFIEASYEDYEYGETFNQTNTLIIVRGGLEWQISGKTWGFFKIGYLDRDYEDEELIDVDGLSYHADMVWQPASHTLVRLFNSRDTLDSAIVGETGYIIDRHAITLTHELTQRLALEANAGIGFYDFQSPAREDTRVDYGLSLEYDLSERFFLGAGIKHASRDSDIMTFEFEGTQVYVSIGVLLD